MDGISTFIEWRWIPSAPSSEAVADLGRGWRARIVRHAALTAPDWEWVIFAQDDIKVRYSGWSNAEYGAMDMCQAMWDRIRANIIAVEAVGPRTIVCPQCNHVIRLAEHTNKVGAKHE